MCTCWSFTECQEWIDYQELSSTFGIDVTWHIYKKAKIHPHNWQDMRYFKVKMGEVHSINKEWKESKFYSKNQK